MFGQPSTRYFEWRVFRHSRTWRPFHQRVDFLDGGSVDYFVGPLRIRKQVRFRDRYYRWRLGLTPHSGATFFERSVLRDGGSVEWFIGRVCIGRYVHYLR